MATYAGVDVSLRSVAVRILEEEGKTVLEPSVPFELSDKDACLRGGSHALKQVGAQAGAMSQHLFFGSKEAGVSFVGMEAPHVNAALSAIYNKTGLTDAPGIAGSLRSGWFSPVHLKSRATHATRALL